MGTAELTGIYIFAIAFGLMWGVHFGIGAERRRQKREEAEREIPVFVIPAYNILHMTDPQGVLILNDRQTTVCKIRGAQDFTKPEVAMAIRLTTGVCQED